MSLLCDILLFYHGQESNHYGRNKSLRKKKTGSIIKSAQYSWRTTTVLKTHFLVIKRTSKIEQEMFKRIKGISATVVY